MNRSLSTLRHPSNSRIRLLSSLAWFTCILVTWGQVTTYQEAGTRASNASEALTLLKSGDQAYNIGDYKSAVERFRKGLDLTPAGSRSQTLKVELADRYATAASQESKRLVKNGRLDEAKTLLDDALSDQVAPNNQAALRARDYLDDPIRTNPALTPGHVKDVDHVRRLLYKAEGSYNLGKFDDAKKYYEDVLKTDAYNKAARRGLERVAARQSDYYRAAYDHTRAELLKQVDQSWELPVVTQGNNAGDILTKYNADQVGKTSLISQKLNTLTIPQVDLDQVDIIEAVDFLRAQSKALDINTLDERSKGIQFIVKLKEGAPELANVFNLQLSGVPISTVVENIATQTKTNVEIDDYAVIFTSYSKDNDSMVVRSYNVSPDFLSRHSNSQKEKSKDPFALDDGESSSALSGTKLTAREILSNMGVSFEGAATASFIPATSTLLVKNNEEQLQHVSGIIETLVSEQPAMIALEAKLISISQLNTEEVGVDWSIQGSILDAINDGVQIAGGSQGNGRPIDDITGRPITAGNRSGELARGSNTIDNVIHRQIGAPGTTSGELDPFILANSGVDAAILAGGLTTTEGTNTLSTDKQPAPGIFSVSAGLNPGAVEAMLRGLSQKKGSDMLLSPSVTTRSGELASIKVGREFIYATEYEPPEISSGSPLDVDLDGDGDGGFDSTWELTFDTSDLDLVSMEINGKRYNEYTTAVTPSHPTAFETVLLGSDLEIQPVLGQDKRTINLGIRNTYKDFDGYINYGSPINALSTSLNYDPALIDYITSRFGFDVFDDDDDFLDDGNGIGDTYLTVLFADPFPPGPLGLNGLVSVRQEFFQATPNHILMPVFNTINAETSVTIYDGATVILGGLMTSARTPVNDKTPILGKLPLIGGLFENNVEYTNKKQILIAVTARVIDPTGRPLNTPIK